MIHCSPAKKEEDEKNPLRDHREAVRFEPNRERRSGVTERQALLAPNPELTMVVRRLPWYDVKSAAKPLGGSAPPTEQAMGLDAGQAGPPTYSVSQVLVALGIAGNECAAEALVRQGLIRLNDLRSWLHLRYGLAAGKG
jgi:hypothetical protein